MDKELSAMNEVLNTISDLDTDAQKRVMFWVLERLNIGVLNDRLIDKQITARTSLSTAKIQHEHHNFSGVSSLAELLSLVSAKTDSERILVVAAYVQEVKKKKELTGREINQELHHMGYRATNVTRSIDQLKAKQPQLMIQLKKDGTTRQAQKKYSVTHEGIKLVESMIFRKNKNMQEEV